MRIIGDLNQREHAFRFVGNGFPFRVATAATLGRQLSRCAGSIQLGLGLVAAIPQFVATRRNVVRLGGNQVCRSSNNHHSSGNGSRAESVGYVKEGKVRILFARHIGRPIFPNRTRLF